MKILALELSGYRSFYHARWESGDLNVLIGPNASGKSNLLRLLELASVAARGGLGQYVQRAGGMDALVWDGVAERISLGCRFAGLYAQDGSAHGDLTYELSLGRIGQGSSYRIDFEALDGHDREAAAGVPTPTRLVERMRSRALVFDAQGKAWKAPDDSLLEEETLLSLAAGPFSANRRISLFRQQLAAWAVYHDLNVSQRAPLRQAVIARTEERVATDGQNLVAVLHTLYTGDRQFKHDINAAMRAAFGNDFEELVFPPAADQRIQLRIRWKSLKREQSAADLSDGTLRFLFLLTVLASPSPPPLIAIDEPETGLHPAMLPIVAEFAADAARRTQVLLSTHSPQLLDAFGEHRPVTTVVKCDEGKSRLHKLAGPRLEEWLKDYTLGELFKSGEAEELGS